jgi:hypothetical protein
MIISNSCCFAFAALFGLGSDDMMLKQLMPFGREARPHHLTHARR